MRVLLLFAALLAGCQSYDVAVVDGPDGEMFEVTCYDGKRSCFQGARKTCHGDYEVLDSDNKVGVVQLAPVGPKASPTLAAYNHSVIYFRCAE